MVETVYTPDGKLHTLLGSCTIQEIVREYAGEDAAKLVENLVSKNARAEAIVETDLLSYEQDLEHWHRMAQIGQANWRPSPKSSTATKRSAGRRRPANPSAQKTN